MKNGLKALVTRVTEISVLTTEDLIAHAHTIGGLNVKQWEPEKPYEIEIHFKRLSGSQVWAKGTGINFYDALKRAIEEAEMLRK